MEKQGCNQSRNKESAEEMERSRVAFNLRRMRMSYTMGDLLEERSRGVSTELSLSHYDPFTIKKKMKPTQANQVAGVVSRQETNRGLKVRVWDVNTGSMHRLVFKRWSTSRSYIFNDGWTKDFVKRRNLAEGDEIGIYWDKDQCRFTFSVLSRACLVR
ncbi:TRANSCRIPTION FACTOR B3-DOMAIN FAMILY-RELATED [Salix koriyanagi]|uniref:TRANSCRIPTION FACTOR B3-DOMAIN FAMILY-RELATED n=1 Tax=Salix koriyanagi TaxID=2511006 RepID=A0A9Q0ZLK9_9ROSI|nr:TRANSCRIPTION FACTOR B3-DOMAIN FAMILY-RELATED [Salix koriyanagi]